MKNELAIIEKICGSNFKKYKFKRELNGIKQINEKVDNFKEDDKKILSWTKTPYF